MKVKNKNYPYYDNKYINNLYELLYNKKDLEKTSISYYRDNRKINKSFKDLYNDSIKISNYFYNKYKNKHIGLIGENSYEWLVLFLGIILSGNVVVPIDKDSDLEKLKYLIKKADVKEIYYSKYYIPFIDKIRIKANPIENINDYTSNEENKYLKNIDNKKLCCIFFTSGTTGANKAVSLSEENITSDICSSCMLFKPNGSVISVLPYHHAFGLITGVLMPIYYEEEVFINSSIKNLMRDFSLVKPNLIFLVPAFVENFYKQIWRNVRKNKKEKTFKKILKLNEKLLKMKIDLRKIFFKDILNSFGNLEYIICGGAYLDEEYVKWFRNIGITILNGYGITECSPVLAVNRNHYYADGSVGVPLPCDKIKIIDNEICVKGPNVFMGYYKDKKATEEVFIDDYFKTGDLGYIKNDFLYITGRIKNIIILSNGENISPELIEEVLLKDEGVEEVVVYEKDKNIVAEIYPSDGYFNDNEYFDNLIKEYNYDKPFNQKISYVKLRDKKFIRNTSGKIIRSKVGK